ncbi:hypothetical protein FALBO_16154 [Fusarium albosuccineum]|uniref:Uncharacterized protein n=1 Tax=Fusarium albosuccineum TaxID=1237068 RepID=A0A8H4KM01_9HYPO|nr:hypothetical protein FALBO_16154 [Fusarium albosuccineum]
MVRGGVHVMAAYNKFDTSNGAALPSTRETRGGLQGTGLSVQVSSPSHFSTEKNEWDADNGQQEGQSTGSDAGWEHRAQQRLGKNRRDRFARLAERA